MKTFPVETWYSQRNNKIKPSATCGITSAVNALGACGWPESQLGDGTFPQTEDCISHFFLHLMGTDPTARSLGSAAPSEPWTVHQCLAYGMNRYLATRFRLGQDVFEFVSNLPLDRVSKLASGRGSLVMSCKVYQETSEAYLDHVVSVLDYDPASHRFLVVDSWGELESCYRSVKVSPTWVTLQTVRGMFKPLGSRAKWVHTVKPYEGEQLL